MKIENSRLDLVTRRPFPKAELIRLVKVNGSLIIDAESKLNGRGYYIHKDEKSITKSDKVLSHLVSNQNLDDLKQEMLKML